MLLGNLDGSRRCCVTSLGKPSFRSAVAWFCVEMESAVKLLVLRCYGFTKSSIRPACLSQPDVKGKGPARPGLPVRQRASRLKCEDERAGRERIFRSVSTFKPLGLTPPTGASSNQMVLVGRSSAHVHGAYNFYTFM